MTYRKMLLLITLISGMVGGGCGSSPEETRIDKLDEVGEESTSCGGGGQSCCANSVCNSGFGCVSNVCRASTIADMNFARGALAGALGHDNRIYAVGGFGVSGEVGPIESYNVVTNHWTVRANIPIARSGLASACASNGGRSSRISRSCTRRRERRRRCAKSSAPNQRM